MIFRYCNENLSPSFICHFLLMGHIAAQDVWASHVLGRAKEQIKKSLFFFTSSSSIYMLLQPTNLEFIPTKDPCVYICTYRLAADLWIRTFVKLRCRWEGSFWFSVCALVVPQVTECPQRRQVIVNDDRNLFLSSNGMY